MHNILIKCSIFVSLVAILCSTTMVANANVVYQLTSGPLLVNITSSNDTAIATKKEYFADQELFKQSLTASLELASALTPNKKI